jgi:hypothetical protein
MRFAASELEGLEQDLLTAGQNEVSYHIYAGVSAVRTSADALALWLLAISRAKAPLRRTEIDFANSDFRKMLSQARPDWREHLQALHTLLGKIDDRRHAAQHAGVADAIFGVIGDTGAWYWPEGNPAALQKSHMRQRHGVVRQLRSWADELERHICALLELETNHT